MWPQSVGAASGGFAEAGEDFTHYSWLRLPDGARLDARAGAEGATVWLKHGHLRYARAPDEMQG